MTLKEQQLDLDSKLNEILFFIKKEAEDFPEPEQWQKLVDGEGNEMKVFEWMSNIYPEVGIKGNVTIETVAGKIKFENPCVASVWQIKTALKGLIRGERQKPLNPRLNYVQESFGSFKEYEDTLKENLENIQTALLAGNEKLVEIFKMRQKQLEKVSKWEIQHKEDINTAKTSPYIRHKLSKKDYTEDTAIYEYKFLCKFGEQNNPDVDIELLEVVAEIWQCYDGSFKDYFAYYEKIYDEAKAEKPQYLKKKGGFKKLTRSQSWKYTQCSRKLEDCQKVFTYVHFHKQDILAAIKKYSVQLIAA